MILSLIRGSDPSEPGAAGNSRQDDKPQHKWHRQVRGSTGKRGRDAPATHSVCPLEEQED